MAPLASPSLLFLLLSLLLSPFPSSSTVLTVGDSHGWTLGVDYSSWTAGKTFKSGDILFFPYVQGTHDVAVITKSEYDSCTAGSGSTIDSSGNTNITLSAGSSYYLCSVPGHCSGGMKLAVVVAAASTPAPAPVAKTPTPSPIKAPTRSPIKAPTPSTKAPAKAPASSPSKAPASSPTTSPTPSVLSTAPASSPESVPAPSTSSTPPPPASTPAPPPSSASSLQVGAIVAFLLAFMGATLMTL